MMTAKQESGRIELRALERGDFTLLAEWLNAPHVVRWWGEPPDMAGITAKYAPRLEKDSTTLIYVIQVDGKPAGIIQCYRHADYPDYDQEVGIERAAGIDYLIGNVDYAGKGFGTKAIQKITKLAFELYPEVDVLVSVPQKDNRASCRALEKAGFTLVDERQMQSENLLDGTSGIYVLKRDQAGTGCG